MKQICKITGAVVVLVLMSIADIPYLSENLVPEAQAMRGRGAAFVVGAAVGSAGSAPAPAASSSSSSTSHYRATRSSGSSRSAPARGTAAG